MTKDAPELKPCPFCGDSPYYKAETKKDHAYIGCADCGFFLETMNETLIPTWNTRATSAQSGDIDAIVSDIQQYTNLFTDLEIGDEMDEICKRIEALSVSSPAVCPAQVDSNAVAIAHEKRKQQWTECKGEEEASTQEIIEWYVRALSAEVKG